VAIVGEVHTANLGIERIVTNVTANTSIRFLLLCGRDSSLFRPGQTLCALIENGIDEAGQIIGAQGYHPVVRNIPRARIEAFRRQVELIDWTDEKDADILRARIADLAARTPGPFASDGASETASDETAGQPHFTPIRIGGTREPLIYDPKGFFVITVDRAAREIVVRHYLTDNSPAHEVRGRNPESIWLALIREGLISQLSHAAYLGAELAKAEASLRLDARYEQDRPLRPPSPPPEAAASDTASAAPPKPEIPIALTWEQLSAKVAGDPVNVAVSVTELDAERQFAGTLAEPREEDPFRSLRRTTHIIHVCWTPETRIVMGTASDIAPGALIRTRGTLGPDRAIQAEGIAIITNAATIE
jgi:tetrahydromethanopterin S-methyltransferase subunit A